MEQFSGSRPGCCEVRYALFSATDCQLHMPKCAKDTHECHDPTKDHEKCNEHAYYTAKHGKHGDYYQCLEVSATKYTNLVPDTFSCEVP